MIGQKNLLSTISKMIDNDKFPSFSIIVGAEGSGKKTLAREIVSMLRATHINVENKIDDIRNFIELNNSQTSKIVYILYDMETASLEAKNSLLKVLEEPAKNSHIILLTNSKESLLSTILSRGVIFEIEPYYEEDFKEYVKSREIKKDLTKYLKVCNNIGELETAFDVDIDKYIDTTYKMVVNMKVATLSELLLVPNKLELSFDKNDMSLFINSLQYNLNRVAKSQIDKDKVSIENIINVSKGLGVLRRQLNFKSMNKKYLLDEFFINMWRELR